nr:hypothetical protein [Pontibacter sp. BAB1700]
MSPERLVEDGLLDKKDIRAGGGFDKSKVNYPRWRTIK